MSNSISINDVALSGYDDLIAKLLDDTFSGDPKNLANRDIETAFEDVLCGQLGMENASFYFEDKVTESFQQFHEAFPDGSRTSLYRTSRSSNPAMPFEFEKSSPEELRAIDNSRANFVGQTTAKLCFEVLTAKSWYRSKTEIENKWVLVSKGERALYCWEWAIRSELESRACKNLDLGRALVKEEEFVNACWNRLYQNVGYPKLRGLGENEISSAMHWLRKVIGEFSEDHDFAYLVGDSVEGESWISKSLDKLPGLCSELLGSPSDLGLLSRLCSMILEGDDPSKFGSLDYFFSRSRISPEMELLFGPNCIVAFLLSIPTAFEFEKLAKPRDTDEESGSISQNEKIEVKAFLLGVFADEEICQENAKQIRSLFYALTLRDVVRLSNLNIRDIFEAFSNKRKLIRALNARILRHEFQGPLGRFRDDTQTMLDMISTAIESSNGLSAKELVDLQNMLRRSRKEVERVRNGAKLQSNIVSSLAGTEENIALSKVMEELSDHIEFTVVELANFQRPKSNKVSFMFEESSSSELLRVDMDALRMAATIISDNACEAFGSKAGKLELFSRSSGDDLFVDIVIRDSGPGIDSNLLPELLSPERVEGDQIRAITTKNGKGLGIGLAICLLGMKVIGGHINAKNTPNGTEFVLSVPKSTESSFVYKNTVV